MPQAANILLVDDQPARLLTYEAILTDLGHNLAHPPQWVAPVGRPAITRPTRALEIAC